MVPLVAFLMDISYLVTSWSNLSFAIVLVVVVV